MLLTEEFPLSSHCIWSLCTAPPPPPSIYACPSSGDTGSSAHPPGAWVLREGLRLLVLHARSGPQDVAAGEVVWAAGFLLPRCLDDTVPVCFRLFPLGSWWHPVCFRWCRKTGWQTQPRSFIPVDGLYLESNLQNTCVQGCIYSCYRHQLWSFSHLCLCLDGLI